MTSQKRKAIKRNARAIEQFEQEGSGWFRGNGGRLVNQDLGLAWLTNNQPPDIALRKNRMSLRTALSIVARPIDWLLSFRVLDERRSACSYPGRATVAPLQDVTALSGSREADAMSKTHACQAFGVLSQNSSPSLQALNNGAAELQVCACVCNSRTSTFLIHDQILLLASRKQMKLR